MILLQIHLFRWHQKHKDSSLVRSKCIFIFEDVEEVILPDVNEGMLLSSTILGSYLYFHYIERMFSSSATTLKVFLPSLITMPLPSLIIFLLLLNILIAAFPFRLPSFVKFICSLWFLICSIALFIFFTVKVYLYFDSPSYSLSGSDHHLFCRFQYYSPSHLSHQSPMVVSQ